MQRDKNKQSSCVTAPPTDRQDGLSVSGCDWDAAGRGPRRVLEGIRVTKLGLFLVLSFDFWLLNLSCLRGRPDSPPWNSRGR